MATNMTDGRKGDFIAMLAHELRNPLAPIRNAVQILDLLTSPDAQLRYDRDVVSRQGHSLTRLMDDLLDVSCVTQGKVTLKKEKVDLAVVIARAVESVRPQVEARRHQLTVSFPPQPMQIEGDLGRLAQALANILNNAAK